MSLAKLSKEICENAKISFRILWSNITKETQHLTTEKIEEWK